MTRHRNSTLCLVCIQIHIYALLWHWWASPGQKRKALGKNRTHRSQPGIPADGCCVIPGRPWEMSLSATTELRHESHHDLHHTALNLYRVCWGHITIYLYGPNLDVNSGQAFLNKHFWLNEFSKYFWFYTNLHTQAAVSAESEELSEIWADGINRDEICVYFSLWARGMQRENTTWVSSPQFTDRNF